MRQVRTKTFASRAMHRAAQRLSLEVPYFDASGPRMHLLRRLVPCQSSGVQRTSVPLVSRQSGHPESV